MNCMSVEIYYEVTTVKPVLSSTLKVSGIISVKGQNPPENEILDF